MKILVIGANGYTGSRLVPELIKQGHQVRGLVHSFDRGSELERQGMELRVGDLARIDDVRTIAQGVEAIFNLAGYCREDTATLRLSFRQATRNLVEVADHLTLQKVIWTSNVSVYGFPKANVLLDESSPPNPSYPLGTETIGAEKYLSSGLPTIIVRVASIYGPGRDYIDSVREGRVRLISGGKNWSSRIHVDDLVQVLLAAFERGATGETFLAVDDQPATALEFFTELSQALGVPVPLNLESNAARAFGVAGKALNWFAGQPQYQLNENVIGLLTGNYRCKNDKIKRELGITLKYPSYLDAYEEWLTKK